MAYRCFDVDVHDRVAHLRLSRPAELNTMTADFWRELPEIVTGLSDAGSARCVVISSTGKHFSAGMDLSVFTGGDLAAADAEAGRRNARLRSSAKVLQWTFTALEKARMPVIARCRAASSAARSTWSPRATCGTRAPTPSSACRRSTWG
jgi:enoyl-CoA hydratase